MGSADETTDMISFNKTKSGIKIFDNIENHQCEIDTPESVSVEEESTGRFTFPVDRASSIVTAKLSINHTMAVYVRNHAGMMIEELTLGDKKSFPHDQYTLEFSAPIKLYILMTCKMNVHVKSDETILSFERPKKVYLGVRSHHEQPSTNIKTTDEFEDLARAISYFGSALKTTSCERSYPTLRGHPPNLSLDDELSIPPILDKPDTDVTIEIPANYQSIFTVSSLAYYFGADVKIDENAVIKIGGDVVHHLEGTSRTFEEEVKRVLKQCFFLDCICRTEGYYQVKLHEREQIESEIDLDFDFLYDQSLGEQIRSYLTVPYEMISGLIPTWKKTAHMSIDANKIEFLPYLVNDLSIIRSSEETQTELPKLDHGKKTPVKTNGSRSSPKQFSRGGSKLERKSRSGDGEVTSREHIEILESNSMEHTWIGHEMPIGASKAILDSFKNRLNQNPTDGDIDIVIVINDEKMAEEGTIVDDVYSSRNQLDLTTKLRHQLTTEELRTVLSQEYDFLHYVGHIDKAGFRCSNGKLNSNNVNNMNISTFFLNACTSYQQAIELIKSGAVAGIATTEPVLNSGAERVGKTVARLLNLGFPITSALDIAKSESIMGGNYTVIGDGSTNLTQAQSGIPSLCDISIDRPSKFKTTYMTYPTRRKDLGTITIPYAKNNNSYFLSSGRTGTFEMDKNELIRFASMGNMPVKLDSSLYWGSENEFINQLN
jgi:hypothetical protein